MSDDPMITILNDSIPLRFEKSSIDSLKYFEENPRVYSAIRGEKGLPTDSDDDEFQKIIEKKMWKQPSVKNLIPNIQSHGGLNEPILVRYDTKRVIEGNSRLAAFRWLYKKTKDEKWATIPCHYVTRLTEKQQDAYLSQIHLKGKTPWTAYEKANFCYIRYQKGIEIEEISARSSETVGEIKKKIEAIELMQKNKDRAMSHFSFYDVLIRTRGINNSDNYTDDVKKIILSKIKSLKDVSDEDDENDEERFKAEELRRKLPVILGKRRELRKFVNGQSTMDEAYQNSKPSDPHQKVKVARDKMEGITKEEVSRLEKGEINALFYEIGKLYKDVSRVQSMVEKVKNAK